MLKTFYIFIFCLLSIFKIEGQILTIIGHTPSENHNYIYVELCENDSILPLQIYLKYKQTEIPPQIDSIHFLVSQIVDPSIPSTIFDNSNNCLTVFQNHIVQQQTLIPTFSHKYSVYDNYYNANFNIDTSQSIIFNFPPNIITNRPSLINVYSFFYGPKFKKSFTNFPYPQDIDSISNSNCYAALHIVFKNCLNLIANFQSDTICVNDSLQIQNLSNTNGDSYKWQFTGANISEAYGFTPPPIKYATPGVYPVTLIGGNIPCQGAYHPYFCFPRGSSDTITKNIVVLPAPSFNFGFTDTSLCVGDSLFLDAAVNDATVAYTWSNGKNTPQIWVKEEEFIKVTLQNAAACAAQDSIFITWQNTPTVSLSAPKTTICEGQMVAITATALLQQQLIWNTGENTFSIAVQDSGWYWAEVNNDCGLDRDSLFINVIPDIDTVALPNIITPNADGINDEYTFAAMNDLESYDIFVYNRWGNLVFTGNKQTAPWQGNTNAGENLADGVYFVLFNYKNCEQEVISLKKAVYVMR